MSIDDWCDFVRSRVADTDKDLLYFFEIYCGEAVFGRSFINEDIGKLKAGSHILEIGAGSLLLAYQLVSEGFKVTALEPVGEGISHFSKMRQIVINTANEKGYRIDLLDISAEHIADYKIYDYAFSINVMEHVDDFDRVIAGVVCSLKYGCVYHFTCPNYLFPYEPHFNIPTVFSKRLTSILFRSAIFANTNIADPIGLWSSLNWINIVKVKKQVNRLFDVDVSFDNKIIYNTLKRVLVDKRFAERRSKWMCSVTRLLERFGLLYLIGKIPSILQPSMDCRILKILPEEK